MTFSRRTVRKGSAAALATGFAFNGTAPAVAQAAGNRTLKFIPHANLSAIDPVGTTGYVVRNHGYMVYGTLDAEFKPRP
jgi:peptide/nickel transport system substrate-binding protein